MLAESGELFETYLYLQRRYQVVQAQFTQLRRYYYLIKCAWCKRRIHWKRKESHVPGDTSHGICPACYTDMLKKIHDMK